MTKEGEGTTILRRLQAMELATHLATGVHLDKVTGMGGIHIVVGHTGFSWCLHPERSALWGAECSLFDSLTFATHFDPLVKKMGGRICAASGSTPTQRAGAVREYFDYVSTKEVQKKKALREVTWDPRARRVRQNMTWAGVGTTLDEVYQGTPFCI